MASYEDDHNLKPTQQQQRTTGRRPRLNLDEFFDTTTATTATATADDADTFRMVARAFQQLEADGGGGGGGEPTSLVRMIVEALLGEAEAGAEASGVPDGFTDTLDRVPRGRLGRGDVCPICNSPFLDDPYPLVVRLPCHPDHIFDLECIAPWLKLKSTCPLDRKELVKKRPVQSPAPAPSTGDDDDGEEEWDDQYG